MNKLYLVTFTQTVEVDAEDREDAIDRAASILLSDCFDISCKEETIELQCAPTHDLSFVPDDELIAELDRRGFNITQLFNLAQSI